jgi:hypothetical protein
MRPPVATLLVLFAVLAMVAPANADEIRLKDGTKIIGTIVGFENGSFRVETSYGFALIQKDKVADINISTSTNTKEAEVRPASTSEPPTNRLPAPAPTPTKVSSEPPSVTTTATVKAKARATEPMAAPLAPAMVSRPDTQAPPIAANTVVATHHEALTAKVKVLDPAPPPAPAPPQPVVIRDDIRGNLYVNDTYKFQMFKPPSWELIPAARKALPNAVAALGTYDQTTLLVIGRQPYKGALEAQADTTAKALGSVYENYRQISTRRISLAGSPAIEQRARGTADGRDWSVISMTVMRGADAYTLLGMTWADSDLIQVQENVLTKAINSLTFTAAP